MDRRIARSLIGLVAVIALLAGLMATPGQSGVHTAWAGGTTTITASGDSGAVGSSGGTFKYQAQSFEVYAGILSQITFKLLTSTGTPGAMTWELRSDLSGHPSSTVIATGSLSPTSSVTNTITVTGGPTLAATTTYWLVFYVPGATGTNFYAWQRSTVSVYAQGNAATSGDGSTWTPQTTIDYEISVTTVDPPTDTPTNTFTPTATNTETPTITLTPSDTPTGTLTPSNTPTITLTPTNTFTPTDTFTPSATFTPSNTPAPTWTFTPSPQFYVVTTLTTGQEVGVKYEITAGDIMQSVLSLIQLCFLVFITFLLMLKNRED